MAKELPTVAEGERAERCETCRHWRTDGIGGDGDVPVNSGDCRRRAPSAFMVHLPNLFKSEWINGEGGMDNEGPDDARRVWPLTFCWDWCGEWQAK